MNHRAPGGGSVRWMIPALVLLVALPVGGAIASAVIHITRRDMGPAARTAASRAGSVVVDAHPPVPLLPDRAPVSYDITYEVVDTSSGHADTTTRRVRVRRPFDGLVETRSGPPPGGDLRGDTASSLLVLTTSTPASGPRGFAVAPTMAASDLRFGPALEPAVAAGDIAVRERRRVAGRDCQVFRFGSTVVSGTITPYRTGTDEWADACIDRAGLLLEEVWTVKSKAAVRRLATSVQEGPTFDDSIFHAGDAGIIAPDKGGGLARRVDPASGPEGDYLTLPSPPEGFAFVGRYAVAAPQSITDPRVSGSTLPTAISIVDLWVHDADFVVLEQGATSDPLPPLGDPHPVDLGAAGHGEASVDLRGNEVRLPAASGEYVRVVGTLPLDQITALARSLTHATGTGLRFLDG